MSDQLQNSHTDYVIAVAHGDLFVMAAYGVAAVLLLGLALASWRALRRTRAELAALEEKKRND